LRIRVRRHPEVDRLRLTAATPLARAPDATRCSGSSIESPCRRLQKKTCAVFQHKLLTENAALIFQSSPMCRAQTLSWCTSLLAVRPVVCYGAHAARQGHLRTDLHEQTPRLLPSLLVHSFAATITLGSALMIVVRGRWWRMICSAIFVLGP